MTDQPQENAQNIPLAPPIFAPPPMAMPAETMGDSAGMRLLLPVGRSGWAIAAGYVGLVSIFTFVPGPIAIILSIIAFRDIRKHREKHGNGRAVFGLIAGLFATGILIIFVMAELDYRYGAVR